MGVTGNPGSVALQAAALALLAACLALAAATVATLFVTDWNDMPLIAACGAAAGIARLTHRFAPDSAGDARAALLQRLAEIAACAVIAQLWIDVIDAQLPVQFGAPVVNWQTFTIAVPLAVAWLASIHLSRLFDRLADAPGRGDGSIQRLRRLAARLYAGGLAIVVLVGVVQPQVAHRIGLPAASIAHPVWEALLYWLVVALLVSHARYESMRRRWTDQSMAIAPQVGWAWMRATSLIALGLAALSMVASQLRATQALGAGRVTVSEAWLEAAAGIGVLRRPLTWAIAHITVKPDHVVRRPPLALTLLSHLNLRHFKLPPGWRHFGHHATHHGGGAGVGDVAGTALTVVFWVVVCGGLVWLVRRYWRRRRPGAGPLSVRAMVRAILARLGALLRRRAAGLGTRGATRRLSGAHRRPVAHPYEVAASAGSASSREQIARYYHNALHGVARRGISRPGAQTPHEFQEMLAPRLAEIEGDMRTLTNAFVEARYSPEEIPAGRVGIVRACWQRVADRLHV